MWGKTEQVQTTGKNLFSSLYDEYTLPSNCYIYPLALEKGETYTASLKSISAIKNIVIYIIKSGNMYPFEDASVLKMLLNLNDTLGDNKATFTVDETFTAPAIAIYAKSKEYFNSIFKAKEIQLEKGSVATSYEPYTGGKPSPSPEYPQPIEVTDKPVTITIKGGTEQQSITLVPPRPLTKWDKLEKVGGVWKWVYQSDNAIYDGSENWIEYSEENRKGVFELRVNSAKRKESADIFCNRYKGVYKPIDRLQDNEITLYYSRLDNNPNDNWIDLKDMAYSDVSEFKNSLFENPLTVYYETTTPEYIPLSQSEQNKLNSLTMYAPTTEIINDGGCTMELTYTVDTKSYVDTKIAEISKAIL